MAIVTANLLPTELDNLKQETTQRLIDVVQDIFDRMQLFGDTFQMLGPLPADLTQFQNDITALQATQTYWQGVDALIEAAYLLIT